MKNALKKIQDFAEIAEALTNLSIKIGLLVAALFFLWRFILSH
jgi:hypothetical protein